LAGTNRIRHEPDDELHESGSQVVLVKIINIGSGVRTPLSQSFLVLGKQGSHLSKLIIQRIVMETINKHRRKHKREKKITKRKSLQRFNRASVEELEEKEKRSGNKRKKEEKQVGNASTSNA